MQNFPDLSTKTADTDMNVTTTLNMCRNHEHLKTKSIGKSITRSIAGSIETPKKSDDRSIRRSID